MATITLYAGKASSDKINVKYNKIAIFHGKIGIDHFWVLAKKIYCRTNKNKETL